MAQGRLHEGDIFPQNEVLALSLENLVRLHAQHDIQVAGRSPVQSELAFAAQPQPTAVVHTGRHPDLEFPNLARNPPAVALLARMAHDLAFAPTDGAGHGDAEKSLALHDLSGAIAVLAGLRSGAGFGPGTTAGNAGNIFRNFEGDFGSLGRIAKGDGQVVAQVVAGLGARSPGTAAAEAKELPENVGKRAKNVFGGAKAAKAVPAQALVAETIIARPGFGIAQHFIGLGRLLELGFGFGIIRVAVRMVFEGHLPIGLLDIVIIGVSLDAEHFVVIPGHWYIYYSVSETTTPASWMDSAGNTSPAAISRRAVTTSLFLQSTRGS